MANTVTKVSGHQVETVPSKVAEATEVIPLVGHYAHVNALIVLSKITAISGSGAKLTTTVEDSVDGGTTWTELESFSESTSTGSKVLRIIKPFGPNIRLNRVIGGTTPKITVTSTVYSEAI